MSVDGVLKIHFFKIRFMFFDPMDIFILALSINSLNFDNCFRKQDLIS